MNRLIVWDLDGTLVDTRPCIIKHIDHITSTLKCQDADLIRSEWLEMVGKPVKTIIAACFVSRGVPFEDALAAYATADFEAIYSDVKPFFEAKQAAEYMRRFTRSAISTSRTREQARFILKMTGMDQIFAPVVCVDDVSHPKPHPESLEVCATANGAEAKDVLMVGDSPIDIAMANRFGCDSISVGYGFGDKCQLMGSRPTYYAGDTVALSKALSEWWLRHGVFNDRGK